uniref:Uncharacterized protein n=1 Tax=Glossina palpalis gambiensis TaxID=67801 RepID=A0A1B0AKQ0_9MUSC
MAAPNDIFSKLLREYPKLWGVQRGKDYMLERKRLADRQTAATGRLVTEQTVQWKIRIVRRYLSDLDNSTADKLSKLGYFQWFARELGLTRAVERLTNKLNQGSGQTIMSEDEFVEFDKTDKIYEDLRQTLETLVNNTEEGLVDNNMF